jgi:hypothetical protein
LDNFFSKVLFSDFQLPEEKEENIQYGESQKDRRKRREQGNLETSRERVRVEEKRGE